jgi:probable F420-dependent oxidoreductase
MTLDTAVVPGRALARQLGPVGLWTRQLDVQPTERVREVIAELEDMGWSSLWIWEAFGREALTSAALLLAATRRMVIATGIANVWARDPVAMAAAQRTLVEAYPGRFVLGIGVSHGPLVDVRGHQYNRPLEKMRSYLDAMDAAPFMGPPLKEEPQRVLAALGPRMLELAAQRSGGALLYNAPPGATASAREVLGEDPLLAVEQAVLLEDDPTVARGICRGFVGFYLTLPNYVQAWERMGFGPEDRRDGGSDRMVDAVIAWGDTDTVARRVQAHLDAGADHVCLQVLGPDPDGLPLSDWRALAPAALARG